MPAVVESALVLIIPIVGALVLSEIVVTSLTSRVRGRWYRKMLIRRNALITLAAITALGAAISAIAAYEAVSDRKAFTYAPSLPTFVTIGVMCMLAAAWATWRVRGSRSSSTR